MGVGGTRFDRLPYTGAELGAVTVVGAALLAAGTLLLAARRRKQRTATPAG